MPRAPPPSVIFDCAATDQTLDTFLQAYAPSRVPRTQAVWIAVIANKRADSNHNKNNQGDVVGLQHAWLKLCELARKSSHHTQPSAAHIETLATRYRVLSGKWMLFPSRSQVDADWRRIAAATASGFLGSGAKVSPMELDARPSRGGEPMHLVCVYVDDFMDARDVWRVRTFLRLMGFTQRLGFKADAYTHLNIYRGNEWGIPATLSAYGE